jgi:hypothetical protein
LKSYALICTALLSKPIPKEKEKTEKKEKESHREGGR